MPGRFDKFLALPHEERRLLIEAAFALAVSRLALALLPFRTIAARLGQAGRESSTTLPPAHDSIAGRVGRVVETMARHLPGESRCLAQALAAWWMLARRKIEGTVYFGVAHNPDKPFDAHAWLRCGKRIVTGGHDPGQFKVISCFSRKKL